MEQQAEMPKRPPFGPQEETRQPVFNVPGIVLATIVLLLAVHSLRAFVLGPVADERLIFDTSFVPACYGIDCAELYGRSVGAGLWTPLTHALLHGDWTHLTLNAVWLLAFGAPVARRLGSLRYAAFLTAGALAGAAVFFVRDPNLLAPMIGASGAVSALMGGACRFAFGPLGRDPQEQRFAPRLTVAESMSNRTILVFVVIFFATNLLTASSFGTYLGGGAPIAWEAHLGGFVLGFLAFGLFERRRPI